MLGLMQYFDLILDTFRYWIYQQDQLLGWMLLFLSTIPATLYLFLVLTVRIIELVKLSC